MQHPPDFDGSSRLLGHADSGTCAISVCENIPKGDEMTNEVSATELAEWLGLARQTVSGHAADGKVVRLARGKYLLKESVQTYTKHLREVAAARGGEAQILDLNQERARLAREQADGQELKNRQSRRELVLAADVEREWSDILRGVRAGILAVTSRVRASAGLSAEQAIDLDAELRRTLTDLGNDQSNTGGGAEGVDTAAENTAVRVDGKPHQAA
jgi:phage terminase Nu1 subunit (DNA packaging protein)